MQMNAWSYEPVSSKKQIKDNLKIEPSIKVYTNLAKALECAFILKTRVSCGMVFI